MTLTAELSPSARQLIALAVALFLVDVMSLAFEIVWQEHGLWRMAMMAAFVPALIAMKRYPLQPMGAAPGPLFRKIVLASFIAFILFDVGAAIYQIHYSVEVNDVRLDQGANIYRADLLLLKGTNPYGRGELLDMYAYEQRAAIRKQAGYDTHLSPEETSDLSKRYWQTLDSGMQQKLLPPPPPGNAEAELEYSQMGYKYGPTILLLTAPLVWLMGPAAVTASTILAFFVVCFTVWKIMRVTGADKITAMIATSGVIFNFELVNFFIMLIASDIWSLMFGFFALLSALRGNRTWPGVWIGLAIVSKLVPGLLFMPIMFMRPFSWKNWALLFATMALCLAPWLARDAQGFWANVVLWSANMQPDISTWVPYAPPELVRPIKAVMTCVTIVIGLIACRDMYKNERAYGMMAMLAMAIITIGSGFHNNYLSWFMIWVVMAAAEWACLASQTGSRSYFAPSV